MSRVLLLAGLITAVFLAAAWADPPEVAKSATAETAADQPAAPSEYWLGIGCGPAPLRLRAKLELPENQGLLVAGVAPESPAEKAGIEPGDVLLRAANEPLADPRDLVKAVEAAKNSPLKIELLRDGKPMALEATPVKRPPEARLASPEALPGDWELMQRWMERMMPRGEGDDRRPPMHFRFWHPGTIVPRGALAPAPWPAGLSIVVRKESDEPARIVVRRGNEKWETTEPELDKLPADVRPHVERMLGRGPLGMLGGPLTFDFVPDAALPDGEIDAPAPPESMALPRGDRILERIERRFDETNRRIDQLMREMEELHEGQKSEIR